jgi:site-specific recombinase XerD
MAETSPLRRRMIEDMTVRNLSPATQRSYVHAVSKFSRFFGRSPETLTLEDVRTYQVHLASKGVAWASLNQTVRRCGSSMASRSGWRRFPSGSLTPASRGGCRWC